MEKNNYRMYFNLYLCLKKNNNGIFSLKMMLTKTGVL